MHPIIIIISLSETTCTHGGLVAALGTQTGSQGKQINRGCGIMAHIHTAQGRNLQELLYLFPNYGT